MKTTSHLRIPVSRIGLAALFFAAAATTTLAQSQCIDTNTVKYLQPPNLAGYDVSDGSPFVLADDFVCTNTGPITGIHIWGSWLSDVHGAITNFVLGIYSDVPAVTNSAGVTPSHPGALLWTESFPAGQYVETIYSASQEQFISPASVDVLGRDTNAWYYCFFPTSPFTQLGNATAPVTYWLAVYAEGTFGPPLAATPQFGWKTTFSVRNDTSVNTPWPGSLPPAGAPWNPTMTPSGSPVGAQPLDLAFELTTSTNIPPPPPCCPDANGVKYVQPPDLSAGVDVDATSIRGGVLADDFPCTTTGAISDIHIWGSWVDDLIDNNATFMLSIWADVPSPPAGGPSHPGLLLWTQTFGPGEYTVCPFATVPEQFDVPGSPLVPVGASTNLQYLCFTAFATNVFTQTGGPNTPTNYWLSVSDVPGTGTGQPRFFGWKTSSTHYSDTAVSSTAVPFPTPSQWLPMASSQGLNVDMAFKIDTATNTPTPVPCMESNGVKYLQPPNLSGPTALDVWNSTVPPTGVSDGPWWLADDWVCTNSGEISDIHLWGSWQNDLAAPGTITFELYVLNDVPKNASNPFSHPGTNVLWHQTFAPGTYSESIYNANAQEQFMDPGPPVVLGTENVAWYYCFNPTNLVQFGSVTNPQTYWLAAFADLPVGTPYVYGWKTTTNVQHDISVHEQWKGPGVPPTNSSAWNTNYISLTATAPDFVPFDLSFKLTTPTNCCPIAITNISTNIVVVTWNCGILQSATNVLGPYLDVVSATSPYTNVATTPPTTFYRAKCN